MREPQPAATGPCGPRPSCDSFYCMSSQKHLAGRGLCLYLMEEQFWGLRATTIH